MTLQFYWWMVIDVDNIMPKYFFQFLLFSSRYKHLKKCSYYVPHFLVRYFHLLDHILFFFSPLRVDLVEILQWSKNSPSQIRSCKAQSAALSSREYVGSRKKNEKELYVNLNLIFIFVYIYNV